MFLYYYISDIFLSVFLHFDTFQTQAETSKIDQIRTKIWAAGTFVQVPVGFTVQLLHPMDLEALIGMYASLFRPTQLPLRSLSVCCSLSFRMADRPLNSVYSVFSLWRWRHKIMNPSHCCIDSMISLTTWCCPRGVARILLLWWQGTTDAVWAFSQWMKL